MADARLSRGGRWSRRSSPSPPISICSAASPTCSCSTAARVAPSTIRTCSARSWCCPRLLAFQRMLTGRLSSRSIAQRILLLVMLAALFLTFSRAAWGQFAFAAALLMALTFVTSRSPQRAPAHRADRHPRTLVVARCCWPRCSRSTRSPTCSRSAPPSSRTTTSAISAASGATSSASICARPPVRHRAAAVPPSSFREDPHNTFLNTFMSGGWLTGFAYLTPHADHRDAVACASCSCARPGSRPTRRSTPPILGVAGRKRHHRHRPLAPLFPDPRRALGPDGGLAARALAPAERAAVDEAHPCAQPRRQLWLGHLAERSAARLAHQSGGLGVPSSNLGAPTKENQILRPVANLKTVPKKSPRDDVGTAAR